MFHTKVHTQPCMYYVEPSKVAIFVIIATMQRRISTNLAGLIKNQTKDLESVFLLDYNSFMLLVLKRLHEGETA